MKFNDKMNTKMTNKKPTTFNGRKGLNAQQTVLPLRQPEAPFDPYAGIEIYSKQNISQRHNRDDNNTLPVGRAKDELKEIYI